MEMASAISAVPSMLRYSSASSPSHLSLLSFSVSSTSKSQISRLSALSSYSFTTVSLSGSDRQSAAQRLVCLASEYKFPDPIPEFAEAETEKFRTHLLNKLSKKKDIFGDSIEEAVGICTEIFSTFLHTEYGGPGTLMVVPFIDMADTLNEQGLPGGPQAARAAVKWAQDHVDKDWKEWTSNGSAGKRKS